jgi:hypothetical protein
MAAKIENTKKKEQQKHIIKRDAKFKMAEIK